MMCTQQSRKAKSICKPVCEPRAALGVQEQLCANWLAAFEQVEITNSKDEAERCIRPKKFAS